MGKYNEVENQVKFYVDASVNKAHKQQNTRATVWLPGILLIHTHSN